MAIPADALRFVIVGKGPGSEIWQTGIWMKWSGAGGWTSAALLTLVNALQARVTTWWTSVKPKIYTSYTLEELRAYAYDGTSDVAVANALHSYGSVAGTLASTSSPIDTACVVTTLTDFSGRSHRGRMYIPRHEVCSPSTGLFNTVTSDYANATATLLAGLNSDSVDGKCSVLSRVTGTLAEIKTVRADQRPDVQRRRENRIAGGTISSASV